MAKKKRTIEELSIDPATQEMLQRADAKRSFDMTGWRTAVSLDGGLADTIEFIRDKDNRLSYGQEI